MSEVSLEKSASNKATKSKVKAKPSHTENGENAVRNVLPVETTSEPSESKDAESITKHAGSKRRKMESVNTSAATDLLFHSA